MTSQEKIALSERWTKIATILPNSISASERHPPLYVEPSGFRRIVTSSISTCEKFLSQLKTVEDELEKRMPGITSYYSLVVAPHRTSSIVRNYGGMVSVSGQTVSLPVTMAQTGLQYALGSSQYASTTPRVRGAPPPEPEDMDDDDDDDFEDEPTPAPEVRTSIFQKVGDIILHNDRRLGDSEVIAFNRALEILGKTDTGREIADDSLTVFGALDEVLAAGKVFGYRDEESIHFIERHEVKETKAVKEDMVPLDSYWGTLSRVNRVRLITSKLEEHLNFPEVMLPPKKNNKKKKEGS